MAAGKAGSLVSRMGSKVVSSLSGLKKAAAPRFGTFMHYARVELRPPSPGEIPQITEGFNNLIVAARTQKWRQLTVKEAWLNTLVGLEIAFWFFAGEIIGKGGLVGYAIPGAVHYGPDV